MIVFQFNTDTTTCLTKFHSVSQLKKIVLLVAYDSMTKTRKKIEPPPPVEIIDDDDEEELKTLPPENKKQQDQTLKSDKQQTSSSSTSFNRNPTLKSKYFQTTITTPPSTLKSLISDEHNERYDIPDELKIDSALPEEKIPIASSSVVVSNSSTNRNGKRSMVSLFNNRTSLSDDDDSEEEAPISTEVPISKKKKPNKPSETMEPIVISSMMSEIQSIPDEEEIIPVTITPEKPKEKITENKVEKTPDKPVNLNVEVITSSPSKIDPINIKIEKWNDEWKQITESHRISCNNLFEEVFNELKKEWALKEENKSRFKQGLELAGKLMSNNSQKARLFYLTLSYYILFEKKDIQLIGYLYDSLTGNMESNPLSVSVDFSSIEFEIVCKEFADRKDILTLLKKYHSLTLIAKAKRTTTDDQTNSRLSQLTKIFNHQYSEIMKHQAKEKK